ncbi:anti-sigma factor [Actinoplanes oblitus]|uniref:Anti-sigma factor n=1 Tax=Actinoplanes oblitus TaxID=3040509 RepID=A0ABY8WSS9_9ACTN|nr:anti-sigma factor [Actinoplanes oblitus]WIM99628.1 anti-sigma factor [Actinoplanes oblitus]
MDPDRLVLLALSEEETEASEAEHLMGCAGCRHDFEALRTVADLGAEAEELRDLPPPPERIWRAIEADVSGPARRPAPVTDLAGRRGRFRRRLPVLLAAAAVVLAVAGTVVVDRFLSRPPAEQVTARATLSPLPAVPDVAGGDVQVLADGQLRIDVRNLPLTTGFHEVWLIDPDDLTKMVALGNLTDRADALLPVPPGTDLHRYRLVDVSDEPHDGDAAHSGHSLLRGTLTN